MTDRPKREIISQMRVLGQRFEKGSEVKPKNHTYTPKKLNQDYKRKQDDKKTN